MVRIDEAGARVGLSFGRGVRLMIGVIYDMVVVPRSVGAH